MEYAAFTLVIMVGLNIILHLHIKSRKQKMKNEGIVIKNLPYINTFFIYSFMPTMIVMLMLNVEFIGFIIFYSYFIVMLLIGNYAYKKTTMEENTEVRNEYEE